MAVFDGDIAELPSVGTLEYARICILNVRQPHTTPTASLILTLTSTRTLTRIYGVAPEHDCNTMLALTLNRRLSRTLACTYVPL